MKRIAGLLLLIVVVVVVFIALRVQKQGAAGGNGVPEGTLVLKGLIGGEKSDLLKDPDIVNLLQSKYGIALDVDKRGSLEMVAEPKAQEMDFLWPSSQVAAERYKELKRPLVREEVLFNSPLVLYSWDNVVQALLKAGIVEQRNNSYFLVDLPKLFRMIRQGEDWKALGVPELYGKVTVFTTDPNLSSSGMLFAGLLANVLNSGQVVNEKTVGKTLPTLKTFFEQQGFMEQNSGVMFQQFVTKGVGDKPIIVGYEAQVIEYGQGKRSELTQRKNALRILYPQPTVWSSHPILAVNEKGKRLIAAMQDPEIQRLAWEKHGFRSAGTTLASSGGPIEGIPETIENVVPLPVPRVIRKILSATAAH